jgi:hypothetical protein
MNAILVKIFATALAFSQTATAEADAVLTRLAKEREVNRGALAA